jgi:hypothetical protein
MIRKDLLPVFKNDIDGLSALQKRQSGDTYSDDDLAIIERSYDAAFELFNAYGEQRVNLEWHVDKFKQLKAELERTRDLCVALESEIATSDQFWEQRYSCTPGRFIPDHLASEIHPEGVPQ